LVFHFGGPIINYRRHITPPILVWAEPLTPRRPHRDPGSDQACPQFPSRERRTPSSGKDAFHQQVTPKSSEKVDGFATTERSPSLHLIGGADARHRTHVIAFGAGESLWLLQHVTTRGHYRGILIPVPSKSWQCGPRETALVGRAIRGFVLRRSPRTRQTRHPCRWKLRPTDQEIALQSPMSPA